MAQFLFATMKVN